MKKTNLYSPNCGVKKSPVLYRVIPSALGPNDNPGPPCYLLTMKKWFLSLTILAGLIVVAIFQFSQPTDFPKAQPNTAYTPQNLDFKEQKVRSLTYNGVGGTQNYLEVIENPENNIPNPLILITGLEDITENWWKTAEEALRRGFQKVYIIELRGQGRSQRPKNNFNKSVHISDFSFYTEDLIRAFQAIEAKVSPIGERPFVIAHSTGALVYAASLKRIKKEWPAWTPLKISFWTPLIQPDISPLLNNFLIRPMLGGLAQLSQTMNRTLLGRRFVLRDFDENKITGSRERYEWSEKIRVAEGLASSGVSLRWALEMVPVAEKLLAENYRDIEQPCLIFTAENDQVVRNDWSVDNQWIRVERLSGSAHALHLESPPIFRTAVENTFSFFLAPK